MANQSLSLGSAQTLVQNTSYALPSGVVRIQSSAPVETSLNESDWSALTNAELGGAETGALFVRSPSVGTTVVCKKASEQPKVPISAYEQNYVFGIGNIPTTVGTGSYTMVPIDGYLTSAVFTGNNSLTANDTNYLTFGIKHWDLNNVVQPDLLAVVDANTTKATGGNTIQAGSPRQLILGSNLAVKANERIQPNVAITGTLANTVSFPIFNMKFSPYPPGTSSVPVGEYQPVQEVHSFSIGSINPTGSNTLYTTCPLDGRITKVQFSSGTQLLQSDTNYLSVSSNNHGQSGESAKPILVSGDAANSTRLTGGYQIDPQIVRNMNLNPDTSKLTVKAGDRITFSFSQTGTLANAIHGCVVTYYISSV